MLIRRTTLILLAIYLTVLTLASLWPTPVDGGGFIWYLTSQVLQFTQGISWLSWLQYNQLEAIANALLYLPLGVFLVVLLPKLRIWWLLPIPVLVSVLSEASQRFFLPARYSTLDDVYHNALGGVIGVVISVSIRQLKKWLAQGRST